jgi:SAM-dependent methyltransferase
MTDEAPRQQAQSAIDRVFQRFPFRDRDNRSIRARTLEVATRFLSLRPPPATVADLGTGQALLPGVLAALGYEAIGVDDYRDPVHDLETVRLIEKFADEAGFQLVTEKIEAFVPDRPLGAVSLMDVIEHLHDSPRGLLNHVRSVLEPGGLVAVVMPSSVNLRKRLDVLRGKTNYPPLRQFFEAPAPWRGHVREYTPSETGELLGLAGFEVLEVRPFHAIVDDRMPKGIARLAYLGVTGIRPALRDSFLALGRKPPGWRPVPESAASRTLSSCEP